MLKLTNNQANTLRNLTNNKLKRDENIHVVKIRAVPKEISESRPYIRFINSLKSPATRKDYARNFHDFCTFHSVTPNDIVSMDTEELQVKLEDWVMDL